ncbi:Mip Receptor [Frankliniella occidentalis]|nr:Mip Receptor [Frankliniella occidentalis]
MMSILGDGGGMPSVTTSDFYPTGITVSTTEIPGDLEMVNCTQPSNHSLCTTPVPHYLNISNELPLEYARPM